MLAGVMAARHLETHSLTGRLSADPDGIGLLLTVRQVAMLRAPQLKTLTKKMKGERGSVDVKLQGLGGQATGR